MEVDCPQFESVVPITLTQPGKWPEVCGSGVMARYSKSEILFTAAHVLDLAANGQLCAPCGERFDVLHGYIWKNPLLGVDRENDPVDVGCVAFPPRVHRLRTFRHLKPSEVCPDQPNGEGVNGYTIVGFPLRKTERRRSAINTAQQCFTGSGLSAAELEKLGLSPQLHIAIRFRLRKALHGSSELRKMAPHPRGMSGGGIFAWPKAPRGLKQLPDRFPLVGIFHTFDAQRSLMIGTRIEYALGGLRASLALRREQAGAPVNS